MPLARVLQRAVMWRMQKRAVLNARAQFRRKHPPWVACDRCIMTFSTPSQWRQHAAEGCRPKHVRAMLEAMPFRYRHIDEDPRFGPARETKQEQLLGQHVTNRYGGLADKV